VEGIVEAGGLPVILPVLDPSLVEATLEGLDGLLVPGGGDIDPRRYHQDAVAPLEKVDPARDDFELPLVRAALAAGLPILGVCRGHQVVNVALGGTLVQHVSSHDDDHLADREVHEVRIAPASLLASVVGATTIGVNSLHHQAVDVAGNGLQVVARSLDGHIEAVEGLGDLRVIGVQWQPELVRDRPGHAGLFEWLVREAAATPAAPEASAGPAAEVGPIPAGRAGRAVA
jgi:putative glutamine amidotransferase